MCGHLDRSALYRVLHRRRIVSLLQILCLTVAIYVSSNSCDVSCKVRTWRRTINPWTSTTRKLLNNHREREDIAENGGTVTTKAVTGNLRRVRCFGSIYARVISPFTIIRVRYLGCAFWTWYEDQIPRHLRGISHNVPLPAGVRPKELRKNPKTITVLQTWWDDQLAEGLDLSFFGEAQSSHNDIEAGGDGMVDAGRNERQ